MASKLRRKSRKISINTTIDPLASLQCPVNQTICSQMASRSPKINLKLLIDTSSNRVLFAEAGKDFVDFLFGLLELPLGSILSHLAERGMMKTCSIGKVYETVKNLDPNNFQLNETKSSLLNPPNHPSSKASENPMLQKFGGHTIKLQQSTQTHCPSASPFSSAGSSSSSVFGPSSNLFGGFRNPLEEPSINLQHQIKGYVKGPITYMVMDDLMVKPISTISSITILNTFRVRDVGCLQEKTVEVDFTMALKLVKASFESTTVLTDVFLADGVDPKI